MSKLETPTAPSVGERLFLWRNSKGWSQDELARQAGVSRSAVALTEIEQTCPRLSTVRRLAWTFGVTVDEFLHGPVPERDTEKQT